LLVWLADDLSPLAAALCAIGELEQHDMIEDDEALTYRTMAVGESGEVDNCL
jgi:hypothetical protein